MTQCGGEWHIATGATTLCGGEWHIATGATTLCGGEWHIATGATTLCGGEWHIATGATTGSSTMVSGQHVLPVFIFMPSMLSDIVLG